MLIIGTVAFAAATTGHLHRRLHRPGDTGHIVGMGTGYVAMPTAFYVDNGLRAHAVVRARALDRARTVG